MTTHGLWRNGAVATLLFFILEMIAKQSMKSVIGDPDRVGWVAFAKAGGIAVLGGMVLATIIRIFQFLIACPSIHALVRYHARYLKPLTLLILHTLLWLGLLAATVAAVGCYTHEPITWGIFAVMTLPACGLAVLSFRQFAAHGRKNQAPLQYIILDHALDLSPDGGVDSEIADHDPRLLNDLLNLKDQDFICISAVHFSSLLADEAKLRILKGNNPSAEFYYMPHFPFSLDILVRAQELGHGHREGYLAPAVKSVYLCKKVLQGQVRFRHNPTYLRLLIWGKLSDTSRRPLGATDIGVVQGNVADGGFRVQRYIRGHDGSDSPLFYGNFGEWKGIYRWLIRWFFVEWRDYTAPASLPGICGNPDVARKLVKSMGLGDGKAAVKCIESHKGIVLFFKAIDDGGVI